ncbi:hypothetical protein ACWGST_11725 [Agromyces sp. NPDC055520]
MTVQTTRLVSTTRPVSTTLNRAQSRGLRRLGDVVIPGDAELPSFSRSGVAPEISRMLPYMNDGDRSGLLALLTMCAILPKFAIRVVVAMSTGWRRAPEPVAGALRMANIGIKGVVHSLYWSDIRRQGIHEAIGYDARVDEASYEASLAGTTIGAAEQRS